MTEAEWLACEDQLQMLASLSVDAKSRKAQLFHVACCRRVWAHFPEDQYREDILLGERDADGLASSDEMYQRWAQLQSSHEAFWDTEGWNDDNPRAAGYTISCWLLLAGDHEAKSCGESAARLAGLAHRAGQSLRSERWFGSDAWWEGEADAAAKAERVAQCHLLRDIFGNPFRPVAFGATRRTATALSLAQAAYEERELPSGHLDTARLGVLADALEEAGCADEGILSHLRSAGPHVRGCWAVDLVLGKG